MGRKSSVDRLPPQVKAHLNRRLREGRLTLDELIADLRKAFPEQAGQGELPSRSALHRHSVSVREIVAHEREMQVAAEALVGELGEDFDAKSGALLAQAVTTLASKRALQEVERARDGQTLDISDVLDLARAAKVAQEARSLNWRERRAVAEEAKRKLLQEQRAKLDELGKAGEVPPEVLARVIKAAYDL
ncbi:MAG: DUF3486 family protein [Pseudomonadota bacterium]|nr:DUF3486 family protein [Pseudomonadota bacterium]